MTQDAWAVVGRAVRERRLYLGLNQDELAGLNGPAKTTVSKIERGVMDPFTMTAQQQIERALGWRRGAIHELHRSLGEFGLDDESLWIDLIDMPPPDALALSEAGTDLSGVSDLALLAEIARRFERGRQESDGHGQQPAPITELRPKPPTQDELDEGLAAADPDDDGSVGGRL